MQSETITQGNLSTVDWHEDCFKYCQFQDFEMEGEEIDSIFLVCTFANLDWYAGLFNICNFIRCEFVNCTFRGCSFPDCKFVECSFTNCQFLKNSFGSDGRFDRAIAYGCSFENVHNFNALLK